MLEATIDVRDISSRDVPLILHDIQNALRAFGGVVQLMSSGVMQIGGMEAIDVARQSLDALRLKMDLLAAARCGVGTAARIDETDDFSRVSRLCAAYVPYAQARGLRVGVCQRGATRLIEVDWLALSRLLGNLIVNAIQHSRARTILVCVDNRPCRIVISVQDDGVGMSDEVRQLVRRISSGEPVHYVNGRQGLVSCFASAAAVGARLQLADEHAHGVRWDIELG